MNASMVDVLKAADLHALIMCQQWKISVCRFYTIKKSRRIKNVLCKSNQKKNKWLYWIPFTTNGHRLGELKNLPDLTAPEVRSMESGSLA